MLLFTDLSRRLPVSNFPDRQLTLSFGTFIELARIGASVDGYRLDITPFPEGEPGATLDGRPIADVRFVRDSAIQRDPKRSKASMGGRATCNSRLITP